MIDVVYSSDRRGTLLLPRCNRLPFSREHAMVLAACFTCVRISCTAADQLLLGLMSAPSRPYTFVAPPFHSYYSRAALNSRNALLTLSSRRRKMRPPAGTCSSPSACGSTATSGSRLCSLTELQVARSDLQLTSLTRRPLLVGRPSFSQSGGRSFPPLTAAR